MPQDRGARPSVDGAGDHIGGLERTTEGERAPRSRVGDIREAFGWPSGEEPAAPRVDIDALNSIAGEKDKEGEWLARSQRRPEASSAFGEAADARLRAALAHLHRGDLADAARSAFYAQGSADLAFANAPNQEHGRPSADQRVAAWAVHALVRTYQGTAARQREAAADGPDPLTAALAYKTAGDLLTSIGDLHPDGKHLPEWQLAKAMLEHATGRSDRAVRGLKEAAASIEARERDDAADPRWVNALRYFIDRGLKLAGTA